MTTFDTDSLKKLKLKISLPVLLLIVGLVWKGDDGLIYYLDGFFMSDVQAEELAQEVKVAVSVANLTSMALLDYIRRQELRDTRTALTRLEDQLNETLLWEAANGENTISLARKEDLEERIDIREIEIECLVTGGSDCDQ
jgi:hypothetical protein